MKQTLGKSIGGKGETTKGRQQRLATPLISAGEDGKTITQTGSYDDPIEGPMKLRTVTKMVYDNTEIFEMYGTGKRGTDVRMKEITYTRKQ